MSNNNRNHRKEAFRALSYASQYAISIFSCLIAGVFLGRTLDKLFRTSPALSILFSLLGVVSAVMQISQSGKDK